MYLPSLKGGDISEGIHRPNEDLPYDFNNKIIW